MYFVKYGAEYLHDPRTDDCHLLDLSLDCGENSCGFCDFSMYPTHPMYNKIRERDADNPIEVYDNDILLFSGFIYELGIEFYLDGKVKCKGELDYLSESVVRPYSTISRGYGTKVPESVTGYFSWLIEQHNAQVKQNKQFKIGINQGAALDKDNKLFNESYEYPSTIDEIKEKIFNTIGGYIRIRHVDGVRYIDYLSEWVDSNTQILDFGKNLTDYTQTDNSLDLYTYVIPIGAKLAETEYDYDNGFFVSSDTIVNPYKTYYMLTEDGYYSECGELETFELGVSYYEYDEANDESDLYLTIYGLGDGTYGQPDYKKSGDIIYCESAAQKYGMIGYTYKNTDILTKEELIDKSIIDLKKRISPKRTIEIKAVDMHLVNPEIKPIRIGEFVRVRSKPHNLDSYFLCANIELDLNNPENSKYTLGTTFDTLTGQQNKRINELNTSVNKQSEKATTTEKKVTESISKITARVADTQNQLKSTVTSAKEEYALSLDIGTSPTEGWSETVPEYTSDKFVWRRLVTEHKDGSKNYGEPVLLVGNSGQKGDDAVLLRIDSSKGTVFKNDSISTILSVKIYKGSERIDNIETLRSVFGSGAYLQWSWQKITDNTFGVISVDDQMISNDGFNLTITSEEVDTKVTFMCELIV